MKEQDLIDLGFTKRVQESEIFIEDNYYFYEMIFTDDHSLTSNESDNAGENNWTVSINFDIVITKLENLKDYINIIKRIQDESL
jgi:hypothetical protein